MARRHRLLIPEARAALDSMKDRVVDQKQVQLPRGDGGDMTTRQAGALGGEIGGSMVQKLIEVAEQTLVAEQKIPPQD
ncbi:alpha/beta-type small acid-soluble spore protein [Alicyclobacillus sp. ALC3]|uniref:alpha/beta-type small acid-soluble spore protein n=1 Tax=Alicyclobacillus sp. ALC3 TaxID=2796143 RepID=UPI002379F3C7|nr:alpha/beta-type small acid-soluble spore protein [Alicyclobacillus sp. ALC3]WDL96323.1 alpha/beta-type small acid-soluble spore protein [Alicyclobacillus sp. ALC3]